MKEKITNKINFGFGLLPILIGAGGYIYNNLLNYYNTDLKYYLLISFILYTILMMVCVFFIFKSYYGYSYEYLPSPNDIHSKLPIFQKYYDEYREYFQYHRISSEEVIKYGINRNINKIYRQTSSKNRKENLRKSKWLRRFSWTIIAVVIILAINLGLAMFCNSNMKVDTNEIMTLKILEGGE